MKIIVMLLAVFLLVGGVFSGAVMAQTTDTLKKEKIKDIITKIENDIGKGGYSQDESDELVGILGELSENTLNKKQKNILKGLIISDIVANIKQKRIDEKFPESNESGQKITPVKVRSGRDTLYYIGAQSIGPINWFLQPTIDITGGVGFDDAGWFYNINGNNDLYEVEIVRLDYRTIRYTLYFYDEDFPSDREVDAAYDLYRLIHYGRTEDIEKFYVIGGDIHLWGIWSNDRTFAYPGQHGYKTQGVQSTIYIAVWNHAMAFNDDNPKLSKIWWHNS